MKASTTIAIFASLAAGAAGIAHAHDDRCRSVRATIIDTSDPMNCTSPFGFCASGTVEGNPVFIYHDAFNPDRAEVDDLKARYRAGKVGDVEVKTKLARAMNALLEPMRERRREVMARPDRLREIAVEVMRDHVCRRVLPG